MGYGDGYTKTAGIYGSYDLNFSYTRTNEPTPTLDTITSSDSDTAITALLASTLTNYNGYNLTSKLSAFGNVLAAQGQKTYLR